MRVLVCGGRTYSDRDALARVLAELRHTRGITLLIAGGARGADTLAEEWAKSQGIACEVYQADWNGLGRTAGPIRNQRMLDGGRPELVVAFPGGRGTADMVRRARAAGVETLEVSD
jgi:predicted Rossmann-fold nucleotide-binding protein